MSRRRAQKPKRERRSLAALGGSAVARAAFGRPGGRHDRRRTPRSVERARAIRESQ